MADLDEFALAKLAREMAMNIRNYKAIFADFGIDERTTTRSRRTSSTSGPRSSSRWSGIQPLSATDRVKLISAAYLEQVLPVIGAKALNADENLGAADRRRQDSSPRTPASARPRPTRKTAAERFVITINLGADVEGKPVIEKYDKSIDDRRQRRRPSSDRQTQPLSLTDDQLQRDPRGLFGQARDRASRSRCRSRAVPDQLIVNPGAGPPRCSMLEPRHVPHTGGQIDPAFDDAGPRHRSAAPQYGAANAGQFTAPPTLATFMKSRGVRPDRRRPGRIREDHRLPDRDPAPLDGAGQSTRRISLHPLGGRPADPEAAERHCSEGRSVLVRGPGRVAGIARTTYYLDFSRRASPSWSSSRWRTPKTRPDCSRCS